MRAVTVAGNLILGLGLKRSMLERIHSANVTVAVKVCIHRADTVKIRLEGISKGTRLLEGYPPYLQVFGSLLKGAYQESRCS